jgi:arylsulfatase A-like enzyme
MKSIITLFAVFTAAAMSAAPAAPNIVVILADDVGWGDAGCHGATKVKTPNIDRIAREGLRFEEGHASAAVCTPTRYSMITGQYSWRRDAIGLHKGVANGDSPLLIPTDMVTAPGLLKEAGYKTALIGKWHLGFCTERPNYNKELRPGPLEVGFNEYFGFPATNDRIPTVFVRGHQVQNLDPADPIRYTYNEAEAKRQGMTKMSAGRNRIGWTKGGKSAWWKDIDISDTFTGECVKFIERNKDNRFLLVFTPHDVHAPTIPHPRFAGTSGLGARADMLHELDASIGVILDTLDKLGLAENTLVIYSSDNGAYVNDENGHKPTGPFRGKKSQLWEGGHRVPFMVRWPAKIKPGVSADLVSTIDIPATICAAANVTPTGDALPDSFNLLPAMLGEENPPKRDHLVVMSGTGDLALRSGALKYMPDLAMADGWYSAWKSQPAGKPKPALFDLTADPGEKDNLVSSRPADAERLAKQLAMIKGEKVTRPR